MSLTWNRTPSTLTREGVERDNQLFQQAKREKPDGTVSEWAQRAQELKTEKPA